MVSSCCLSCGCRRGKGSWIGRKCCRVGDTTREGLVQPPVQIVAYLCRELDGCITVSVWQPASQVDSTAVHSHRRAVKHVCLSPKEGLPQTSQQPGLHLREGTVDLVCSCWVVLGLTQHIIPSLQVPCSCLHVQQPWASAEHCCNTSDTTCTECCSSKRSSNIQARRLADFETFKGRHGNHQA